jgi:hypothetical protein
MTATVFFASAVLPGPARNARNADGLAKVATSNAGGGGKVVLGCVS